MKEILNNRYIQWVLGITGLLSVLVLIVGSFFNSIAVDSSIILVEMERIAEGYVPYKTLHLNYPPLWFYINVALKWLFHVPYGCYHFYLAVHWLYAIGCASCLYYISRQWGVGRYISLLVVWLFFIVTHWTDGEIVLFEIPSVFWGLLAICLYYKFENYHSAWQIVVGAIACCSFLTKQFGAGFLLLVIWLIVTSSSSNRWKQIGYYLLGYCIPLLICLVCFGTDIYKAILFNGYGLSEMNAYWGKEVTFTSQISRLFHILLRLFNRVVPIVYVAIVLFLFLLKQGKWRETLLCFFAIGGFALQFFFVCNNWHYHLYLIPFALLLIPLIFSINLNIYLKGIAWGFVGVTTALGMYSAYHNRVWKLYMKNGKELYEDQWKLGKRVADVVRDGETIYIPTGGVSFVYYTANVFPPCISEIGYAVGPMEINQFKNDVMISHTDYVLHFTDKMIYDLYGDQEWEYFYNDSVRQYVDQFPCDTIDKDIVLHYLNRSKLKEE